MDNGKIPDNASASGEFNAKRAALFSSFLGENAINLDAIARSCEDTVSTGINTDTSTVANLNKIDSDYVKVGPVAEDAKPVREKVFRAQDKHLNRFVAVKSLPEETKDHPEQVRDFLLEAKITAQLDHPGIVTVYNIYEDDSKGSHIAMKLVNGKTLRAYLDKLASLYEFIPKQDLEQNERKSLARRLDIFLRICDTMVYAHHKNVIHRDLKPENVMIGKYNEVYVLDWGLAEYVREHSSRKRRSDSPCYAAPEIIEGLPYGHQSDIYSLGLLLFELVFLKKAYRGNSSDRCIDTFEHRFGYGIPKDLKMIIRKATAVNPHERYDTVAEMADDIRRFKIDEEVSANPDNFFRKTARSFYRKRRVLFTISFLVMLLAFSAGSFYLYRELLYDQMEKKHHDAISIAYVNGLRSAMNFDYGIQNLGLSLRTIAREISLLLELAPQQSPGSKFYPPVNAAEPAADPPGYVESPAYGQKISLEEFVWKHTPGTNSDELEQLLRKIHPIRKSFRRVILESLGKGTPTRGNEEQLKKILIQGKMPILSFVYFGLSNGLYVCFPYTDDYPEDFDPRNRPWYQAALASPNGYEVWGKPYLDIGRKPQLIITCSMPIRDHAGKIIGCVGADVSLSQMIRILTDSGQPLPYLKNKFLLDKNGVVLLETAAPAKKKLHYFASQEAVDAMWKNQTGLFFSDDMETLYFYTVINSMNWLYVEEIDYGKLTQNTSLKKGQANP